MKLTVSFPWGVLGSVSNSEFYNRIHQGLTEIVDEKDVRGVQVYPAQWPRKVLITLNERQAKEALLIAGINVFGQHIELKDENEEFTRVTVKDLMVGFPDQTLADALSNYGTVVKIENEMIHVNGKKTSWTTGTRYVSMCPLIETIPQRLSFTFGDKQITASVWYKRPVAENKKCRKCGGDHSENECSYEALVCYLCKGDHKRQNCPQYDGSRESNEAFCFMSKRSPLSNFNTDYPITIKNETYSCNEMYIQEQKALLFGDFGRASLIREAKEPNVMKDLGKKVTGYVDHIWKAKAEDITMTCNRAKVYQHEAIQAYLLKTGNKKIGEGTVDRLFGIGVHISSPLCLNHQEWPGKNLMGNILMELRSELLFLKAASNDSRGDLENSQHSKTVLLDGKDIDSDSMTENTKANSASDEPIQKNCVLLLGDSNLKGVQLDLIEVDLSVIKVVGSQAKINDIDKLLNEVSLESDQVEVIMVHLGSYNWSSSDTKGQVSAEEVYRDYVEALNTCSTQFPNAVFVLSSILPRAPSTDNPSSPQLEINAERAKLNELLFQMSRSESNVFYVDNDVSLHDLEQNVNSYLYMDNDESGLQLNEMGSIILSDNLTQGIRKVFRQ